MKKKKINYFLVVFIFSSLLRILLGFLNREANDNHLEVVNLIVSENSISTSVERCWECFQPKLYHFLGAWIIKLFSINSENMKIIALQFISVIAGIITVYIVYKFLKMICLDEKIRLILFSLIAFNPKLIGINAQATNDSLVIILSVAATYCFYTFLNDFDIKKFFLTVGLIVLATIAKPNALFLLISFILILFLKLIGNLNRKQNLRRISVYLVLFLLLTIPTTAFLGGYYSNYVKYGDSSKTNRQKYPFPHFFNETFYPDRRPGTTSIFNSFLTFRIIDAIKNPIITSDYAPIPTHRTSLWTQLYGRTNYLHFDNFPPSWRTNDPFVINVGRIILLLALVPLLIFIYGLCINIISIFTNFKHKKWQYLSRNNDWLFLIIVITYILFIIYYNGIIRDFASMKAIFLFPALLGFAKIFTDGLESAYHLKVGKIGLAPTLDIVFPSLILLYITDVVCLIQQLG